MHSSKEVGDVWRIDRLSKHFEGNYRLDVTGIGSNQVQRHAVQFFYLFLKKKKNKTTIE